MKKIKLITRKLKNKIIVGDIVLIVLCLLLLLSIPLVLAYSLEFRVTTDKERYMGNEDIYIFISGASNTLVTLRVLNPVGILVYEENEKITSAGSTYIHHPGFSSSGGYTVKLLVNGNEKAETSFVIGDYTTTVITTTSITTMTITTTTAISITNVKLSTTTITPIASVTTGLGTTTTIAATTTLNPGITKTFRTIAATIADSGNVHWVKRIPQPETKIKTSGTDKSEIVVEYDAPIKELTGETDSGPVTETVVGDGFNLSSYATRFELVSHRSSPISQKTIYRIYNDKLKDYSYIAIATSGELREFRAWHLVNKSAQRYKENITYYQGNVTEQYKDAPILEYMFSKDEETNETILNVTRVGYPYYENYTYEGRDYDSPELLFNTSDFMDKWNSNDNVFSSIKTFLINEGVETDLSGILDNSVLPEPDQEVFVYRVPHAQNSWEYLEYETDNKPSKFLAFDPAGGSWWNSTWAYRKTIRINETDGVSRTGQQTTMNITFDPDKIDNCTKEIRVIDNSSNEIPVRILDDKGNLTTAPYCQIQFGVTIGASQSINYTIYYGNPNANDPSYTIPDWNLTWIKSNVYFPLDTVGSYITPAIVDYDCDGN